MEYRRYQDAMVVRLDPGDEVVSCLAQAVKESGLRQASVSGIGAINEVTLGVFDTETHEYHKYTHKGVYEITSLLGNITRQGDEPYLHLHMTVANTDNQVMGGHLNAATVSATSEIYLHEIKDADIDRRFDETIGLNLLEFK